MKLRDKLFEEFNIDVKELRKKYYNNRKILVREIY